MLHRRIAAALVLFLVPCAVIVAQTDSSEFLLTGSFQLRVGSELDPTARMYQSQNPQAVLVVSDQVEAPLLLLPLVIMASWKTIGHRVKEYYLFLLLLQAGMLGVFMALDAFLFCELV